MNERQSYLFDKETGLYNRTVVEAFINKCNVNSLFPLSVMLFELKSNDNNVENNVFVKQFSNVVKSTYNNSTFLARFSNSKIIIFISKCSSNASFRYTEKIAQKLNEISMLKSCEVNVVFDEINKTTPINDDYLSELEKSLQSTERINLAYIV